MNARKKANLLTWGLFGAAVFLLGFSTVGSSRAALTYYNENYQADLEMRPPMGVTFTEDNKAVKDELFTGEAAGIEKVAPGKRYPVGMYVTNTGENEAYMRVILRCYWTDKDGKRRDVSPELIEKSIAQGWLMDETSSTSEQIILYYPAMMNVGDSALLIEDLSVDTDVAEYATWNKEGTSTSYDYDGLTLVVEAEADVVQTHNIVDAIRSVWGKETTVDGTGNITSVQ